MLPSPVTVQLESHKDDKYLEALHPLDRKGQREAFEFVVNSDKKIIIVDAGTGFGKSPIAAYLSTVGRVLALTKEKALQDHNYRESYNFDVLKGKSNYPCGYNASFTAETCGIAVGAINPDDMGSKTKEFLMRENCQPYMCPYQTAKLALRMSPRGSLNYTKFLLEPEQEWNNPDYLFCDEAHQLPAIVKEFSSFVVNWDDQFLKEMKSMRFKNLVGAEYVLGLIKDHLQEVEPDQDRDVEAHIKWNRVVMQFNYSMGMLKRAIEDDEESSWYTASDGKKIVIKPLTAKYNFKKMFYHRGKQLVFTSATIGRWIIDELGIDPADVAYYKAPDLFAPEDRPIYVLKNMPKMNGKSTGFGCHTHESVKLQAKLISQIVARRPDQSHVVLTNSKDHAYGLMKSLRMCGINVMIPKSDGTEGKFQDWELSREAGRVLVTYSMWEGVDLGKDYSIIVTKVPFPPMGAEDSYERSEMKYNRTIWLIKAAIKTTQGLGRNRRGKDEHYGLDKNGRAKRTVFLLDGNWRRIKKHLSETIKDSIIQVELTDSGFKLDKEWGGI